MIKATRHTIIVATNYARKLLKFSLSHQTISISLFIVLGVLGRLSVLAIASLRIHDNASEFACLVEENRCNEYQLEEFNDQFEEIAETRSEPSASPAARPVPTCITECG